MSYAVVYMWNSVEHVVVDTNDRLHVYHNSNAAYKAIPIILDGIDARLNEREHYSILGWGSPTISPESKKRLTAIKDTIRVIECIVDHPKVKS